MTVHPPPSILMLQNAANDLRSLVKVKVCEGHRPDGVQVAGQSPSIEFE